MSVPIAVEITVESAASQRGSEGVVQLGHENACSQYRA